MIAIRKPLAALAVVLLAACGGGGDEPPKAAEPAAEPAAPVASAAPAPTGDTVVVRMVTTQNGSGGQFEPATVTARPGDVLHFVSDGGAAHNVDFTAANPGVAGMPAASTYLMADGQSVDVPVNFPAGTYNFQCEPHLATPMKGVLTVTS
jgi:plastocyanin